MKKEQELSMQANQAYFATLEERNQLVAGLPQEFQAQFQVIDAAFHSYLETLFTHPQTDDPEIEELLRKQGLDPDLAQRCVIFAPISWGRVLLQQFNTETSQSYIAHNLNDGSEQELSLDDEPCFVWAEFLREAYLKTKSRLELFKMVAFRSAEVHALTQALQEGEPEDLYFQPMKIFLR